MGMNLIFGLDMKFFGLVKAMLCCHCVESWFNCHLIADDLYIPLDFGAIHFSYVASVSTDIGRQSRRLASTQCLDRQPRSQVTRKIAALHYEDFGIYGSQCIDAQSMHITKPSNSRHSSEVLWSPSIKMAMHDTQRDNNKRVYLHMEFAVAEA